MNKIPNRNPRKSSARRIATVLLFSIVITALFVSISREDTESMLIYMALGGIAGVASTEMAS